MAKKRRDKIPSIIAREQCIPNDLQYILLERLPIICADEITLRLPRRHGQVRKQESRNRYIEKTARKKYLEVLDHQPGYFLAYILSTSPKSASQSKIPPEVLTTEDWPEQYLNTAILNTLNEVANKHGLINKPEYNRILVQLSKPHDSTPKPKTTALNLRGEYNHRYEEPSVESFNAFAGDWLCELAAAAGTINGIRLTGVSAQASSGLFEDTVMWIEIGRADEALQLLFPHAAAVVRAQEMAYSVADGEGEPWFYVSGASVLALDEACPKINEHIEKSQLRIWEKKNGVMDKTDCVIMKKNITKPEQGVLRVRLSVLSALSSFNQLFSA